MVMLNGSVIVVTGASSGIGQGCVDVLCDNGATVVGFDVQESGKQAERYKHFLVDVRDEVSVNKTLDEVEAQYSKIDALVNCAGIYSSEKPFYEMSLEEWNKVLSINITGTFLMSKCVGQRMIKNEKGKIVNISCIRSRIFRPNMAEYAASKGGVVALTSAMALDLAPYNIQVNSVAPGFTYTDMTKESFDDPAVLKYSNSLIPMAKIADPKEIAKVVLFLLSDLSAYITGETIFVDGGFKVSK